MFGQGHLGHEAARPVLAQRGGLVADNALDGERGSVNATRAPPPRRFSAQIVPPCA